MLDPVDFIFLNRGAILFMYSSRWPTIVLDNLKSNVLILNSKLEKEDNSIESIDVAIAQLLGEEAVEELNSMSISLSAYKEIFYTLIACVQDEEIEEVKKRFQK